MATPAASATEFCTLLAKSKLLPAGEVEALHKRWRDETGAGDDQPEAFARYLAGKKAVTPWQAALVLRGRADGFFLDGYKILEHVGKGQMGGVYKAVHSLGQVVALKILPASRAKDPRVLGRFQREARLLTRLDHPNVVRAFQVGDTGGRHYIAMEYLEGETLDEILARRKRLPVGEAARLVRQALDGLDHLHGKQMIHRDLKPANLMLVGPPHRGGAADTTLDGTVRILDVGLGRALFAEAADGRGETQLTVEGAVVGTPDYMAPEQAKDAHTADVRADVYSLGCVLYHCLTGKPPFPDGSVMTQMLKHATEAPPPLSAHLPDVPPGLQAVLDKFLAKTPADRFQTPADAAQALKRFQATGVGAAPVGAVVSPPFRQWLDTESLEVPKGTLPPADKPASTADMPTTRAPAMKPGTAPAPALPSGTKVKPVAPVKPGTGTAPALQPGAKVSAGTGTAPALQPGTKVRPVAPPPPPTAAGPAGEEVEVELVTLPLPAAAPPRTVYVRVPDERPLWAINRRDLFMLIGGGGGVLGALGVGYGLARLVRALKSSPDDAE
jgi:serine/threonine protein kinase